MTLASETCSMARQWLSARRDGAAHDRSALEVHLGCCPDCRAYEQEFEVLSSQWSRLQSPVPPADLWERIERQLEPVAARRRTSPGLRVAATIAGFLGVHLAARAMLASTSSPDPGHGVPMPQAADTRAFLVTTPEYHLLRRWSPTEESR